MASPDIKTLQDAVDQIVQLSPWCKCGWCTYCGCLKVFREYARKPNLHFDCEKHTDLPPLPPDWLKDVVEGATAFVKSTGQHYVVVNCRWEEKKE